MKMPVAGALCAFALVLGAGPSLAQTSTVIVAKPSGYVLVDPQQRVLVQRYVVAQPGAVVTLPPGYVADVGTTVPATVETADLPDGCGLRWLQRQRLPLRHHSGRRDAAGGARHAPGHPGHPLIPSPPGSGLPGRG